MFKSSLLTNKEGLSADGRAVTKHPQYFGYASNNELTKVFRTNAALNNLAAQEIKSIIRNGVRTIGAGGCWPNGWITFNLKNGKAASWSSDGVFIGFRGIK